MTRNRAALALQPLEDRLAPATFSAATVIGTLVVTQTSAAVGSVVVIDDPVGGTVSVDDTGDFNPQSVFNTVGRANLAVRLQPADTGIIFFFFTSDRPGSLSLSVKNASPRELRLAGIGTIGGSLTVTGGNGGLNVTESGAALHVGRNATFLGGAGVDVLQLQLGDNTSVGGTLSVVRFNEVATNAGDTVGRLSFNAAGEASRNDFNLSDTQVAGSLTYVGGTGIDELDMFGATTRVGGNVTVALGTQPDGEFSTFTLGQGSTVGGRVRVTGGLLGTETVSLHGIVGGSVAINLGGGTNTVTLDGLFNGPTFEYVGGAGADAVNYSPVDGSVHTRFTARLRDGADGVTFGSPTANPSFAYIDFGAGADTFTGTLNFSGQFLNLP
jgi:large repetitive protein